MTRVSVLLTTYNRPDMLREAVESVLSQTYQDFELLILDDNSNDGRQINYLASIWNVPKVRIYVDDVSPENKRATTRYATMINIGLQLARGEYITYLCDDDLFLPDRLERMVARLDQGDCQVTYGAQQLQQDGQNFGIRAGDQILQSAYCRVDHSSVMHTKAVSDEVGGWNDSPDHWTQADAEFWNRLTNAGHYFYPTGGITDIHRFHSVSVQAGGYP